MISRFIPFVTLNLNDDSQGSDKIMIQGCRLRRGILGKAASLISCAFLLFTMTLLVHVPLANAQISILQGQAATIPGSYDSGSYAGGSIGSDGALFNTGALTNESGDLFTINVSGLLSNDSGATLTNAGIIDNSGTINNEGSIENGGTLINETGGTLFGNITNNGSLTFNSADASTYSGVVSGTGKLTQAGDGGTLTLSGINTYTGATIIGSGASLALFGAGSFAASSDLTDDGVIDISAANGEVSITSLDGTGNVNLGPATLILTDASGNFSGGISGAGDLALDNGTETLSGTNTYTGGTVIFGGATLALGESGTLTSKDDFDNFGTLTNAGTFTNAAAFGNLSNVINTGTFINDDSFLNDPANAFDGNVAGSLTNNGIFINNGAVESTGAIITNNGSFTNETGGSVVGNITNNGSLTFNSADASTYSDVVSGTGALTQEGTGTLTLSGSNTYTGATMIGNGATLALSGAGSISASSDLTDDGVFDISGTDNGTSITSLDGTGNVTLGSETLTFLNASGNFSGGISGTGDLFVRGGTETLSGTNTFTGGTEIFAGATLALGANGTFANDQVFDNLGTLANAGTFTSSAFFSNLGNVINAGTFINDNGFLNNPADTFEDNPTGNLTNSGIFINNGTIDSAGAIITNNGTFTNETGGGVVGNITNNGSLIFSADDVIYSDIVSGTGSLTQEGAATLTLSGVNTYTGATIIGSGATLALSGAGSIAASSNVTDDGVFDISGTDNGTSIINLDGTGNVTLGSETLTLLNASGNFSGGISGTGGLVLDGGTETLNGANSYTGATTVADGTLEVGNAANPETVLDSDVTVDGSGILEGHGTIEGDVVNNGAVSPGGSIGILTVDGNYMQNSGGTLNTEVTPNAVAGTGYDQLQVTGHANLAGALAVQVDTGTYSAGTVYDILHAADGVSGSFATTRFNPAFAAYLTPAVSYGASDVLLELTPTPASPASPASPTGTVGYSNSLAFSSGRIYAASNFAQDSAVLSVISSPLGGATAGAADQTEKGYWLHGLGSFGRANGDDFNEKGFVIGKGFSVSPDLIIGGAISNVYTATNNGDSSVNGTSFGALVYGIYNLDRLMISSSAGAGHLGTNLSRGLPTLGETARATSNGAYEAAALQLQYNLLSDAGVFVTPYASASYLHTRLGSAQETNANILDLRYDAMSTSQAELGAGITAGVNMPVKYGMLTPWVQLGGTGMLGDTRIRDTETLGTFSAAETALTAPVGAFSPAVGLEFTGDSAWRLAAAWGGQFGSATCTENFTLQAKYAW